MYFKRIVIFVLLLLIARSSYSQFSFYNADTATTHQYLQQLGKKFLNFTPFTKEFPAVIDSILADTEIRVDTLIIATGTTTFYLRGYHKYFNPFALALDSVRTIISEHVQRNKKEIIDTIFFLQTEGIAVGQDKINQLQPYFKKLDEEIRTSFHSSYYSKTKKKKEYIGEGIMYYSATSNMPALNITWRKRSDLVAVICITFYTRPVIRL
jgi:hypothetical protein